MLCKLMYIHRHTVCTYSVRMHFVCIMCMAVMYMMCTPSDTALSLYIRTYVCIVTANTYVCTVHDCVYPPTCVGGYGPGSG